MGEGDSICAALRLRLGCSVMSDWGFRMEWTPRDLVFLLSKDGVGGFGDMWVIDGRGVLAPPWISCWLLKGYGWEAERPLAGEV